MTTSMSGSAIKTQRKHRGSPSLPMSWRRDRGVCLMHDLTRQTGHKDVRSLALTGYRVKCPFNVQIVHSRGHANFADPQPLLFCTRMTTTTMMAVISTTWYQLGLGLHTTAGTYTS